MTLRSGSCVRGHVDQCEDLQQTVTWEGSSTGSSIRNFGDDRLPLHGYRLECRDRRGSVQAMVFAHGSFGTVGSPLELEIGIDVPYVDKRVTGR